MSVSRFILKDYKPQIDEEYLDPVVKEQLSKERAADGNDENDEQLSSPPAKRKKLKGRNKTRPKSGKNGGIKLCNAIKEGKECRFGEKCTFSHNVAAYMAVKPADIGENCYLFEKYGKCPYSVTCRFASKHLTEDYKNIVNEDLQSQFVDKKQVLNIIQGDLKFALQRKKYDFSTSKAATEAAVKMTKSKLEASAQDIPEKLTTLGCVTDEGEIKSRAAERKKVKFNIKLFKKASI